MSSQVLRKSQFMFFNNKYGRTKCIFVWYYLASQPKLMRYTLLLFFVFMANMASAQLIINEVSQGTGTQEYVEFLVLGSTSCPNECVDIRGWIIDDNNGWYAAGSGNGIANGALRFSNIDAWSCLRAGTLIVVYSHADVNPLIPAPDPNDSNADCVIIIPGNSNLLDRETSAPIVNGSNSYVGLAWDDTPNWVSVNMQNGNDTYQVINPNDLTQAAHAISWGSNTSNNIIYFTGNATGRVFSMINSADDDPSNSLNWASSSTSTLGAQTPGSANSTTNATWINSLNNNCAPLVFFADAGTDVGYCDDGSSTTTTLTASGGVSYEWSTGDMTANTTITPASTTTYTVTVTNASSCTDTNEVIININPDPVPNITQVGFLCGSNSVDLDAGTGFADYDWSTLATTQIITTTIAGTYTVTVTDANTCIGAASIDIFNVSFPINFIR
ncbi:MAG: hypothetical protein ACI94Y_000456 [Maribacter sp.]|jgi:hypothetical protein